MKALFTFILLAWSWSSFSQQEFWNDTSLHESRNARYTSILEVDSGFIVYGNVTDHEIGYGVPLINYFPKDHSSSTIELYKGIDSSSTQRSGSNFSDLFINNNNRIPLLFNNCDIDKCYPRIKEIDLNGNLTTDVNYKQLLTNIGVDYILDLTILHQRKIDNHYIISCNAVMVGENNNVVLLMELDASYNYIHHEIIDWSPLNSISCEELIELASGDIILGCNRRSGVHSTTVRSIYFFKYSLDQAISVDGYYNDIGNYASFPTGFELTADSSFIICYQRGKWINNGWKHQNRTVKLNKSYQELWNIETEWQEVVNNSPFAFYFEARETYDSNYIVVGASRLPVTSLNGARFVKLNPNGERLWDRFHYKIEDDPAVYDGPVVEIRDFIQKKDSGFIAVGQYVNFDEINQGLLGQKGWIIETNCLGHRADPIASGSYQIQNDFTVEFYNTSMMEGNSTWCFSDGTTLTTSEHIDTIQHTFPGYGTYEVMLVAEGCSGRNDTTYFTVDAVKHTDPNTIMDGKGFFTIFPNPVLENNSLFIYLNQLNPENGDVYIKVHASNGQFVKEVLLSTTEGSYEIPLQLSSGLYHLSLYQGEEVLQVEKLLVK